METFPLAAGTGLTLRIVLRDGSGQPQEYSPPGPALTAEVWPGVDHPTLFTPTATWHDPSAGVVDLALQPEQTASLAVGTYRGRLIIDDVTLGPLVASEWQLDVQGSPGSVPELPSYCTYADMLVYGRAWLPTLTTEGDTAGFGVQRGNARTWLDGLILRTIPQPFGTTSQAQLRDLIDADRLVRSPWVVEACARRALALVCETQLDAGDDDAKFARIGREQSKRAEQVAMSRPLAVVDAQGNALLTVNLASRSFREVTSV